MNSIPLSSPDIGDREVEYVTRVLRSNYLSLGPWLTRFEEAFAEYSGRKYAIGANSGTSALHMCVRAMGLGAEDEVITTAFSFVASANCLLYERVVPVFVDIDSETLNLSPAKIRHFLEKECYRHANGRVIDKKTGGIVRAILPVHVFGLPCEMDEICAIAREYGLRILEDACEAIGAEFRAKKTGTFGDAAVFAFYPNKQMTTGEGGIVVTDDPDIADQCRSLRNQGRDNTGQWLNHVLLGFNYRLSDVHCAIGLAQLERIDELLGKRQTAALFYTARLSGTGSLRLPKTPSDCKRSWFVYVIQVHGSRSQALRNELRDNLAASGIASQIYFPAIHRQPYYPADSLRISGDLRETEKAADTCLALPFSSKITSHEIDAICDVVRHTLISSSASDQVTVTSQATAASII